MKPAQGLVVAIVILVLGIAGAAALSAAHNQSAPHVSSAPKPSGYGSTIQLGTFNIPTPSPTIAPIPAPSQPPASAQPTPSPSGLNVAASTLDWEDLQIALRIGGQLQNLSSSCQSELKQAADIEEGNSSSDMLAPGSRLYLCLNNRSCQENGYSAYNGVTPLPSFAPSSSCQAELQNGYQTVLQSQTVFYDPTGAAVMGDLQNNDATNCDHSDGICVSHDIFCSNWRFMSPQYRSLVSICP